MKALWLYEKSKNLYAKKIEKKGADTALIFLSGIGGSHNFWKKEYQLLAKDFSLYFVDTLGFGYSAKPEKKYTLPRHTEALHTFIREKVTEANFILLGYSLGAIIALGYEATYKNAERIILLALPYYRSPKEAKESIRNSRALPVLFTDTKLARIACHILCSGIRPAARLIFPLFFIGKLPRKMVADALLHTHLSYFSTLNEIIFKQNLPALFKSVNSKKITLVHGRSDKTAPFKNIEDLARTHGIKLLSIPNQEHLFPFLKPEQTAKIIRKALKNTT